MIPDGFDWKDPDYDSVFQIRATNLQRILAESAADPALISQLKAYYKGHPVDFVNDWGMTFDPRNAEIGLPSNIPFLLFAKQAEFVNWLVERWRNRENGLVDKSRDMGVSWITVGVAVWMWLYFPGTVVGFGSRKEEYVDQIGDMKALFPKIRFFIENLPREFRPAGYVPSRHAPFMRVYNPENGSSIIGEAGDGIGRGARTSIYFVDESAFLERPKLADAALSQTTNCRIDVSTPNGESNPFAAKRFSGRVPTFTLHWTDHPAKDQAWYEQQKAKINDAVIVAQELDIDYKASSTDQFINGGLVDAAQRNDASQVDPMGPLKMGIDVARFGSNKTVFCLRRGRVVFWIKEFSQRDTMEVVALAKDEIDSMPKPPPGRDRRDRSRRGRLRPAAPGAAAGQRGCGQFERGSERRPVVQPAREDVARATRLAQGRTGVAAGRPRAEAAAHGPEVQLPARAAADREQGGHAKARGAVARQGRRDRADLRAPGRREAGTRAPRAQLAHRVSPVATGRSV